jgi:hypothetical protein
MAVENQYIHVDVPLQISAGVAKEPEHSQRQFSAEN